MTAMADFDATMPMTGTAVVPEEPSKMGDLPGIQLSKIQKLGTG